MQVESGPQASVVSIFNLRYNWKHLANRPASQEPVIDGVRAIAVLWVVALHMVGFHYPLFPAQATVIFTREFTHWIQNGMLGVDLFFVISGFLMGSILFGETRKTGSLVFSRFYIRRFLRLIPVYTAAMVLALYLLHGLPGSPKWANAQNAWANILYVNFLSTMKQYMGWCWSLAIEEQFYLLLPAFILIFLRLGKGRFRVLMFAGRLGPYRTIAVDSAIGFAITLAISSSLYMMIERPCMRMRSHPAVLNLIDFFRRPKAELATDEA
jgi:peptidoglycan/LPS O-acetylase OafA/YrhL